LLQGSIRPWCAPVQCGVW